MGMKEKAISVHMDEGGAYFGIGVVARELEIHPQTLRHYERLGLIKPKRSQGNVRLFSAADIERLSQIKRLVEDLGVNLAGVEVILNLTERMEKMRQDMERELENQRNYYEGEIARLRAALQRVTSNL